MDPVLVTAVFLFSTLYTFPGKSHPFPGLLLTTPEILLRFESPFRFHSCPSDIDRHPSPGQPLLGDT